MYRENKWSSRLAILLISLGLLTGCSLGIEDKALTENTEPEVASVADSQEETVEVLIEIYIGEEEQEEFTHSFDVESGTVLIDLMKDHYRLVEEDGFITCIEGNGQDPDENKFWVYDLNGGMGEVGAADYELQDGDVVEWKLMSFE